MMNRFKQDPLFQSTLGRDMFELVTRLYPICRSITGNGVRETLQVVGEHIPLEVYEVPTGTVVFDWTVPREWNIRDACIKDPSGHKIVELKDSNLHVLNYSIPVQKSISLEELKDHIHTLPDHPDWIPYRTSYYQERWGFCLSHNQLQSLKPGNYEIYIDSTLEDGYLTYGEYFVQGRTDEEVLISCHICHPSLCNDNLSAISVATFLSKQIQRTKLKYSYRFIFIPGTVGSITWLSRNEDKVANIKHGLVLACVGDSGGFSYKKSRRDGAEIDRVVSNVLRTLGSPYEILPFTPYGYDERQFCSPGINLPVGCLMRTPHGKYPQYHTSADDLGFVKADCLEGSLAVCEQIVYVLEHNLSYLNLYPKCEPQLGRRGLYGSLGGASGQKERELAMLWILNLSDGRHSLLDISDASGFGFTTVAETARVLLDHGLLEEVAR